MSRSPTRFPHATICIALCLGALAGCAPRELVTESLLPPATGSLSISVAGLPAEIPAVITLSSAQGVQRTLTGPGTISALQPGLYTITAEEVSAGPDRYGPAPPSQAVTVTAGPTPTAVSVAYVVLTGRLDLVVDGLPPATTPAIQVLGPGGFSREVAGSTTLTSLIPGAYSISAPPVTAGGSGYAATMSSTVVTVTASVSPRVVSLSYVLATGALQVLVTGLPDGVAADLRVTGPGGYSATVGQSTLLLGLQPGTYTIDAARVTAGSGAFEAEPSSQTVTITAALVPQVRSVGYSPGAGSLDVTIAGLPVGAAAAVTVTGPGGFQQDLSGSRQLGGLPPGTYTVAAAAVTWDGVLYRGAPLSQDRVVVIGGAASATVSYAGVTGGLSLTINGLPAGAAGSVQVTGPAGYAAPLTASGTLSGLWPGSYTVTAAEVSYAGSIYAPTPGAQTTDIASDATTAIQVRYAATTGALSVGVSGLPSGVAAAILVSGPGGFTRTVTGSQVLAGLVPGSYSIAASGVSSGSVIYSPAPGLQSRSITAGSTAAASISYTPLPAASLDLSIAGLYLTQATQKLDGSVPLVAGRDAYLRVFVLASQSNSVQPQVRVRLYAGGSLLQTYTLNAPGGSVPTSVNEGTLAASWNLLVPAALVQPGLRALADVDPAGAIAEIDEANNIFPVSGTPVPVDVRVLPLFSLRFVPVLQQANGLQGNVSDANKESFLADVKAMLPVGAYNADVRAVYTTTAPALDPGNANNAWSTILSEVLALRTADASSRYYFGVVKTSYSSGVVGLGYVGGSARTAVGWDAPSSAPHTVAHEVGHNMGRSHAPCGGPANPDPSYPYGGGLIGVWGLNLVSLTTKSPSLPDLMGYCSSSWISDYNWLGMMTYREAGPSNSPSALRLSGNTGLLIWGRVTDDGIVLEPAFTVPVDQASYPALGPHRLELADGNGATLVALSFGGTPVADLPGGEESHFAFIVPVDSTVVARLSSIRVISGGRAVTRRETSGAGDPAPRMAASGADQVELRWNSGDYPMVMVRDRLTGQVLSFARGGTARLWSRQDRFELVFSDGVKSLTRPARIFR